MTPPELIHHPPAPCALCAWCVPPLHMIATPKDRARRAASTALPVPTRVRCTNCGDHGKPMRLMSAADMLPVRQLRSQLQCQLQHIR